MLYVTAGESHGPALTTILSDVPAGIPLSLDAINEDLARRQGGYGRGGRMKIETDKADIQSGVRFGVTLGSPITIQIRNKDWENWQERMAVFGEKPEGIAMTHPRPGHADLSGVQKTNSKDCRDILERASARETAARVAAGGIAKALLAQFGVEVFSFVRRIGSIVTTINPSKVDFTQVDASDVSCPDEDVSASMRAHIDSAREQGESLGGEFTIVVRGLVAGLGGYASPQERLTSSLGAALFSIPAMKGVEFGGGFSLASLPGSQVHDPIDFEESSGFYRTSNNAGGLEGGMTNGEDLVITVAMKPIPTLMTPLQTVDLVDHASHSASKERSDVCAVPAAAVVGEAEVALVLADAYCKKFGGDALEDMRVALQNYKSRIV